MKTMMSGKGKEEGEDDKTEGHEEKRDEAIGDDKHTLLFYKQHVYKHASLGFPEKLSTSLSTLSASVCL